MMSHFTKVELELKDGECIKDALKRLGLEVESGEKVVIKGYNANRSGNIVVRKSQLNKFLKGKGTCFGDMGFKLNKQTGKYELVCDEMDLNAGQLPMGKLKQEYGVSMTRKIARCQGFRVVRETREKGKVRIQLRR
jgi:altronate dehydratase